jgi:hypothetical protein
VANGLAQQALDLVALDAPPTLRETETPSRGPSAASMVAASPRGNV